MSEKSPWRSMWIKPRATIRNVIEQNPKKSLWALAFVYGFTSLLNTFQSFPIAYQIGLFPMLLLALVLAAFWGYLFFSIWSGVILFIGKLFKGKGTFTTIRAAYAWSCVPLVGNVFIWLVLVLLYGRVLFYGGPENHVMLSSMAVTILFVALVAKLVLAIWSIVLYLIALAEVQGFSILRAIGNTVLGSIFLGIVFAVLWSLLLFAIGAASQQSQTASALFEWADVQWIVHYLK